MTRPTGLDPLEELLSRPAPLEGAEFTAAVMRRLPEPRPSSRAWILGIGAALATGAAAALVAPGATGLGPALLALVGGEVPGGAGVIALLALAALGGTAAAVVVSEGGSAEKPVTAG